MPPTAPPGRMVFRSGNQPQTLDVYEGGSLREWSLPAPAISVRLATDGSRVVALLGDAAPRSVWTLSIRDGTAVELPVSLPPMQPQEAFISFSPDLSSLIYVPSLELPQSQLFLVDTASGTSRGATPGGWLKGAQWRSGRELVFDTGPAPQSETLPAVTEARFFTWQAAGEPQEIRKAGVSEQGLSFAPNGDIAYVSLTPDGMPVIRTLGASVPLLGSDSAFDDAIGCGLRSRSDLQMRPPTWSADGSFFAVQGSGSNQIAGFVAIRAASGKAGRPVFARRTRATSSNRRGAAHATR